MVNFNKSGKILNKNHKTISKISPQQSTIDE